MKWYNRRIALKAMFSVLHLFRNGNPQDGEIH